MFIFSRAGRFLLTGIFLLTLFLPSHAADVVNNNPNGEGSLTWAVEQVNAGIAASITISPDLETLHLSQELTFTRNATITGNGTLLEGEETRRLFRVTNGRVIFEGLTFTRGNAVSGNGGAVEIDGSGASAEFRNCIFYSNSARDYGGAVSVTHGDNINPTIFRHCTITANTSQNGGGISVSSGQAQSFSSIIVGNNSDYDIFTEGTGIFTSRYSIAGTSNAALDNTDLTGQNVSQILVSENGIAKPETLNGLRLIRIAKSSPAFNFVKDSSYALSTDIAGTTRPQYGAYDAGAYEIPAVALISADINGVPYIMIGDSVLFSLDITPTNANLDSEDYSPSGIVWHSSSADVITISTEGIVAAQKSGISDVWAEVHGWDSQGRDFVAESKRITVHAGEESFKQIRAEISDMADVSIYTGETLNIKPEAHIIIDRYELDYTNGVYYLIDADSSRPEVVSADVVAGDSISGYTVRLKAGNVAGESLITLETSTIPEGQTVTQSFTVEVVSPYIEPESHDVVSPDVTSKDQTGVGRSSGGCDSGIMLLAGLMVCVFAAKKGEE